LKVVTGRNIGLQLYRRQFGGFNCAGRHGALVNVRFAMAESPYTTPNFMLIWPYYQVKALIPGASSKLDDWASTRFFSTG